MTHPLSETLEYERYVDGLRRRISDMLAAMKDLLGDLPSVQGGICQRCGRDYGDAPPCSKTGFAPRQIPMKIRASPIAISGSNLTRSCGSKVCTNQELCTKTKRALSLSLRYA